MKKRNLLGKAQLCKREERLSSFKHRPDLSLLVPLNIKYTAIQNTSIQDGDGNFTISKTFLPVSEPYAIEIAQWTLSLFALTNDELIETLNNEIEKKGWVGARGFYNDCLKKEIINRTFNSEILLSLIQTELLFLSN